MKKPKSTQFSYYNLVPYIIYASLVGIVVVFALFVFVNSAEAAPAPRVSFTVSPTSLTSGESVALSWSSTDATYCVASEGWRGYLGKYGARVAKPNETTGYVVTCTGAGGTATSRRVVTVNGQSLRGGTSFSGGTTSGSGGVLLSVSPNTISPGERVTLAWSAPGYSTCHASGGWSGTLFTSGNRQVTPMKTTTYELLCIGGDQGSGSDSETVLVTGAPVTQPTTVTPVFSSQFVSSCVADPVSTTIGKTVTFAASALGGKGSVTYQWRGAVDGVGKIRQVAFDSTGTKVTTVTATDSEGNVTSASCSTTIFAAAPAPTPTSAPSPQPPQKTAVELAAEKEAEIAAQCLARGYIKPDQAELAHDESDLDSGDTAEGSDGSFFASLIFGGGLPPGLGFFLSMMAVIIVVFVTAYVTHRILAKKQKAMSAHELTKPL